MSTVGPITNPSGAFDGFWDADFDSSDGMISGSGQLPGAVDIAFDGVSRVDRVGTTSSLPPLGNEFNTTDRRCV